MNKTTVSLLTITQRSRNKCLKNLLEFINKQTYQDIIEWVIVEGSKTQKEAEENKEYIIIPNQTIEQHILEHRILHLTMIYRYS